MEKLLNLLQEFYGENRKFSNDNGLLTMTNGVENLSGAYAQTYIISKQGGFIKRLVENDKIDLDKVGYVDSGDWHYYEEYENVLMRLAIDDKPIKYLLSIIKD